MSLKTLGIIDVFKVNNKNTRKRYEIYLKLTIKTLEWRYWRRSGLFIINFEHISHFFLAFLLLPLNTSMFVGKINYESLGRNGLAIIQSFNYTKNEVRF